MTQPRKRKRGRPPLDPIAPSVALSVKVTGPQFDALCRRALDARRTVAAQLRHELRAERI